MVYSEENAIMPLVGGSHGIFRLGTQRQRLSTISLTVINDDAIDTH